MGLTKQTLALDALGVDRRSYLWAPAWLAVAFTYLAVAALFALGMIGGGLLVCAAYGVPDAWQLLTGDILDPKRDKFTLSYYVKLAKEIEKLAKLRDEGKITAEEYEDMKRKAMMSV